MKNKNILVTGGASGIGKSAVELLKLKEANVFIIDKQKTRFAKKTIDTRDSLRVSDFISNLPLLDGIVLCAALGPFQQDPLDIFETNILGALNVLKACKKKLNDFSSIIIISSTAGYRNKWDDKWLQFLDFDKDISFDYRTELKRFSCKESYQLTKWLLLQATKKFAKDFASKRIRVNCIVPGPTKTNMSKSLWRTNSEEWRKIISENPFNLPNEPSEVASVILFLLNQSTKMITGSFLHVDGGWFATKVLNKKESET